MNNHLAPVFGFVLLLPWLLTGCATTPPLVLAEPLGPAPLPAAATTGPRGALMVYSAWDPFPGGDPDYQYREDYVLHWPGDARVVRVRNHAGTFDPGPVTVNLPPGVYQIKARAARHGKVTATVVIEAGRVTSVWLDGTLPKDEAAAPADQVRLPGGQVVGWRATRGAP